MNNFSTVWGGSINLRNFWQEIWSFYNEKEFIKFHSPFVFTVLENLIDIQKLSWDIRRRLNFLCWEFFYVLSHVRRIWNFNIPPRFREREPCQLFIWFPLLLLFPQAKSIRQLLFFFHNRILKIFFFPSWRWWDGWENCQMTYFLFPPSKKIILLTNI